MGAASRRMMSPAASLLLAQTALLACTAMSLAACAPDLQDAPRLASTQGVDPVLLERIDAAFAAATGAANWRVELAMVYDANGLHALALETYGMCLAADDGRPELWYHQARMQAELSLPAQALDSVERCLALRADYSPAHVRRGEWLLALGRIDEAERALQTAAELAPESPAAWLGLARIHLQRGAPRAAIGVLEPVVARTPRAAFANGLLARAYLLVGDKDKADTALRREERAAEARLDDPWTARVFGHAVGLLVELERAGGALARGDARSALTILEPLHAERPGEFAVVELLCKALIQSGRNERALEVLAAARARHPDHYLLELSTGQALAGLGRLQPAREHLQRSVTQNPSFGAAHVALAEVLFALGRFAGAEGALGRALALDEKQVRTWILLARAQNRLEAPQRAVASLTAALQQYPNSANLWAYKADALARAGRAAEARSALERAVGRDPEHPLLPAVRERLAALEASSSDG